MRLARSEISAALRNRATTGGVTLEFNGVRIFQESLLGG